MLLRDKIDKTNIDDININIELYQRMADFYEGWLVKHGPYEYVSERLNQIYGTLGEYLVARDMMLNK